MTTPRDKLHNLTGQVPSRCFWIDIPSPMVAEIAGLQGPELCVIDAEHGQIGPEGTADMLRALDLTGTPAIVRLGDAGAGRIKHALDAGAAGVLIPFVETADEASAAARNFLTPPKGTRGLAPAVSRAARFGKDADYAAAWNNRGILAVQIETAKGLANAAEIAAVDGVDMLFFGPGDFSLDNGLSLSSDGGAIMAACRQVIEISHCAGKLAGAFPWLDGGSPAALIAEGADLVAAGSDVRGMAQGFISALEACPLPEPGGA
jgi:4-hydroxy-2-oxoheptanedioate aldolase